MNRLHIFRAPSFCIIYLAIVLLSAIPALAQMGSIHGTVTDPSGAVIPSATVTATSDDGASHTGTSNRAGAYAITDLAPGRYQLAVSASGFADLAPISVQVFSDRITTKNIALQLPVAVNSVEVQDESRGLDVSADNNAGAIVIKGAALDALSDDPDELSDELTALAGPAAGPNGGQIYIDGFTGGQLPPKSSIREIRINQNPFSAQYDKIGYGRIEILTKPGSDKFRGMFMMAGNDSAFNSMNPFVTSEPDYYSTFMIANASGPLNKSASWFGNFFRRSDQSNAIINAVIADSNGNAVNYKAAVANPTSRMNLSPRLDLQLGDKNTLTVRYMLNRSVETNDGVSGTSLAAQGYDTSSYEHVLQMSDTQTINDHTVNETRFQYMRDRSKQTPYNTTPTVTVSGDFVDGGSNAGASRTAQDQYELQNITLLTHGAHALNFGTRFRFNRYSSYSTSGFNGAYTYDGSNNSAKNALTDYINHAPSQYSVTTGTPAALAHYFDLGVYYQDDWKFRPNLTLSYGVRWEVQNGITDYSNWAPRFSFAWAPGAKQGKPSMTVIRGGYGWFYDRFTVANILTTLRENGVNQQSYIIKNPSFYQNAPTAATLASQSSATPTIYSLSPDLRAAVSMQAAVGVERQIGKAMKISATYINSRGVHQYLSDNINAYDPSTYDADTTTGTRPNGINENLYQFQSGGLFKQNQLMFNYSVSAKRVSLFGFYVLNYAKADTSGATYFPSNQTRPSADFGRASYDVRHRFLLGGNVQAPFGVSISPMLDVTSGSPFNITLGTDLNGDNQYNDRPAWATASSTDTKSTAYGTFDLNPAWNATRIPYDMGTGPNQFVLNMRVAKSIGVGPKVAKGQGASMGGPGGGPGGPRGGGGLGPGGLSGPSGPPKFDADVQRRYSLNFSVMAHNVFNHTNLAAPSGVLSSDLFGKSTALAGGMFGSQSANRTVELMMSFSF